MSDATCARRGVLSVKQGSNLRFFQPHTETRTNSNKEKNNDKVLICLETNQHTSKQPECQGRQRHGKMSTLGPTGRGPRAAKDGVCSLREAA